MKSVIMTFAAAMAAFAAHGAIVEIGPMNGNTTPAVCAAVARLKNGDTLRFAKGEYHFFEEGAKVRFLASVGSSTGMKKAVVHLEGLKDVTIDGGGSSFVFHGKTFPFIVEKCDGVKICNFTSRVFRLPLVEFTIKEKNDAGFLCQFAKGGVPYETKDVLIRGSARYRSMLCATARYSTSSRRAASATRIRSLPRSIRLRRRTRATAGCSSAMWIAPIRKTPDSARFRSTSRFAFCLAATATVR